MIMPHDARGKPISLKVRASWVYAAVFLAFFSVILVASSVVYSSLVTRKLVNYADTLTKARQQQEMISGLANKTRKVNREIRELANRENELRKLLGLKPLSTDGKAETKPGSQEAKDKRICIDLQVADEGIAARKQSLAQLKEWVGYVRSKLAATPSSWPLYGRVASLFGYRVSPWRGMHTGIDIDSSYGSPARVTADGVVTYIGWRHGYGKTVEVSHGHGIQTLYAHNSNYAVTVGERVKKGQVVSYVGMTGWTTGPHLHYEVRRWGTPLNPIAFLDKNILSASKLWR
jgi:murein DD-endopeptidase MepM/ murein hydrolase activator NlpD